MKEKYDFTVIGTAATVSTFKVVDMPETGKSTAVLNYGIQKYENGGVGFNICAALTKLGMKVQPVLTYVDHRQREFLHSYFQEYNLPCEGLMDPPDDSCGTTILIQDKNKDHMTLITEYARRMPDSKYFRVQEMKESYFTKSRCVILSAPMAMNTPNVVDAIRKYRPLLCFSMRKDPIAYPEPLLKEILLMSAFVFANEFETQYLLSLFDLKTMDDLFRIDKALNVFAETVGSKGSIIYKRTEKGIEKYNVSAVKPDTEEIDTVGAGDGYLSGFMYAWNQGKDIPVCAEVGSIVSSYVIEKEGSTTNLPDQKQVRERYQRLHPEVAL